MVEISKYGSERARAGDRPGYSSAAVPGISRPAAEEVYRTLRSREPPSGADNTSGSGTPPGG